MGSYVVKTEQLQMTSIQEQIVTLLLQMQQETHKRLIHTA